MDLWKDLITLIAVVDPIGTIPIFLTATAGMTVAAQRKVAVRATLIAAGVLTAFIVVGQIVLDGMGITLSAYQVAGGIVLFLFALQMVFDPGDREQDADKTLGKDVAVFPVAIPSMAGPATMMAVVILTDNSRFNVMEQAQTAMELYAVLAFTLVLMLAASPIQRLIGDGGVNIVRRVMGLILAALAVQTVVDGIKHLVSPGMINMKKALPALAALFLIVALSANSAATYPVGRIVTPKGEILFYLYPQTAEHQASFIKLANAHYWDSLTFNRVIKNFVAQGGCPDTPAGFKDSPYNLAPEFYPNIRHKYGAVGAGRDDNPQKLSAGCQFYIVANKNGLARLDDNFTVYGQVIKGMDVVEAIVSVPTDSLDAPLVPIPLTVTVVEMTAAQLEELGYVPAN